MLLATEDKSTYLAFLAFFRFWYFLFFSHSASCDIYKCKKPSTGILTFLPISISSSLQRQKGPPGPVGPPGDPGPLVGAHYILITGYDQYIYFLLSYHFQGHLGAWIPKMCVYFKYNVLKKVKLFMREWNMMYCSKCHKLNVSMCGISKIQFFSFDSGTTWDSWKTGQKRRRWENRRYLILVVLSGM